MNETPSASLEGKKRARDMMKTYHLILPAKSDPRHTAWISAGSTFAHWFHPRALLASAVLTVGFSYATTLKQKQYATHFVIGEGILPDLEFGLFTDNGTEISEFTFNSLMPQSTTEFTYTLKQKSSYNLTAYMRWGYSCLPISYLNIEMLWNHTQWSYTESKAWSTLDEVLIIFRIIVGDNNNTAWDSNLIFTASSTP